MKNGQHPSSPEMGRHANIHNPLRVFIVVFTVFILAVVYGSLHFYRDPLSVFFDPSRAYERHYSAFREHEALAWSRDIATEFGDIKGNLGGGNISKAGEHPRICAAFVTAKRDDNKQYIDVSAPLST